MSQLPLSNVINISVSQASPGVGNFNTSNIGLFTDDAPNLMTFGNLGYAAYLSPTQVGVDFGTESKTFAMANAIFSQQPNILTGGGQLIIILLETGNQSVLFSAAPASGTFELVYNGHASAPIEWNDTASQIQAKLQAVQGLSQVVVTGSIAANTLAVQFYGVYGAALLMTVASNTLNGGITVTPTVVTAGETIGAAVTRTAGLVQYFGVMANENLATIGQTDLLAAAAILLPLVKMGFFVSTLSADIAPGGMIDLLRSGSFANTRGLYYGDNTVNSVVDSLVMMASYASLGLSVNFQGSNTTTTLHLKPLVGVQPDPSMTQTILNAAIAAGADTYISLQGVAAVYCSGANRYFDSIFNQLWIVSALQVAGFNYLAQANTKIPQTEQGMDGLKGAYRAVCEQGVTNQYLAPGNWNSPTTFGVQADLIANVAQRGYYIYSLPVSQQSQTSRAARQAPLVQIALKEAGAIQSSTVIVNINQ